MGMALFNLGREAFLAGLADWDTDAFKAALLDLDTADVGVKAIASSTNATPIVVTATAHGFATGDFVSITGHATNTAANGIWKITVVDANSFSLQRPDGVNSTGNGIGGATGRAVNLGRGAAGDNWDDFDACLVGAAVALTAPTVTSGVADAADPTFTAVTGASVEAFAIYKDTGTASTSKMIFFNDGRQIVTVAAAPAGTYTVVAVEPLAGGIPNGTVLAFSNGQSVTLNAAANLGDRTITVVSTAVALTAGSRADAPVTGSGLPVTPNGGNIALVFASTGLDGAGGIFKL